MPIRPATPADAPAILALLQSAGLPVSDLSTGALGAFQVLEEEARLVGVVGLDLAGEVALLRSLAVDPAQRGAGHGLALVRAAEAEARRRGVRRLFLLTTTADRFFAARGYALADRAQAPAAIRAMPQFSGLCPASSAFMSKALPTA